MSPMNTKVGGSLSAATNPSNNKTDGRHLLQNITVKGVVSVTFLSRKFVYPDDSDGSVQTFIVLDDFAKRLGSST